MPDTPSIVIVKRFTYRGQPEEFSNRYHFSGTTPASTADWTTLATAIINAEKLTVESGVSFVKAYGYEAGNDNSVAQIDYSISPLTVTNGAIAITGQKCSGDVAATARWYTGASSSRGKKIYCRKYFHGVHQQVEPDQDKLDSGQKTALETFCAKLIDGTLPGSFKYCGPQGAVLSAPEVNQYLTTRTLKRRGRRPLP